MPDVVPTPRPRYPTSADMAYSIEPTVRAAVRRAAGPVTWLFVGRLLLTIIRIVLEIADARGGTPGWGRAGLSPEVVEALGEGEGR